MTQPATTATRPGKHSIGSCLRSQIARLRDDSGQTTAEYGLVLLAAATIAMLVVAWAGGTGAISSFFDAIIDQITSLIA